MLIEMLTVCFDASGKETTECLVVAGFCSFSGVWKEFDRQWRARLDEDHLPYFHAVEFAHSTGVFRDGWDINEPRRKQLSRDLMEIIQTCGLRRFGCLLRVADFNTRQDQLTGQIPGLQRAHAYAFAALKAVEAFHEYARGEGVRENLRYVFEKGDAEDHLRKAFREFGYEDPDFAWPKPHEDRKGFVRDPFIGLQAADWMAYEYYLDLGRLLNGIPRIRWAFQQFENLPGHLTFVHHGPLFPNLPNVTMRFQSVMAEADQLAKISRTELDPSVQ